MGITETAALATAFFGCITDVKSRRVPNALTFGAAAIALMFHLQNGGGTAVFWSVAGWAVAVVIFLPFFALGGMGGGDVKLLAALGAWLGPALAVWVALWTAMAGGVMAVVLAFATGYLTRALLNLWMLTRYWSRVGLKSHPTLTLGSADGAPRLPYALPIAAGLVITLWLR